MLKLGFVDLLLDAVCIVDADGKVVYISAACEAIFGYTPQELLGTRIMDLVVAEDLERTKQAAAEIMAGQPKLNFENRYRRKDGGIVHILWSARWLETDRLRIAVARDITERKQAETMQSALYAISEAAHTAEDLPGLFLLIHQIIAQLLPAPNFSVALLDEDAGFLRFPYHASQQHEVGAPQADAVAFCESVISGGKPLLQTSAADSLRSCPELLGVPLSTQRGVIGALMLRGAVDGLAYTEHHLDLLHFVSTQVATAIERKRFNEQLQRMAQSDALTGLPNRTVFAERLERALANARLANDFLALLYIDLDRFKQVNDTLGHEVGDLLLKETARRLQTAVRKRDTVARLGGDEFVVLLEGLDARAQAAIIAEKVRAAISESLMIDGQMICIAPSVGIACYPEHGQDARSLLRSADAAMFAAKQRRQQMP